MPRADSAADFRSLPPALPSGSAVVEPPSTAFDLALGSSRTVEYTLKTAPDPSPVDVFFLVDISDSMAPLQADLQARFGEVAGELEASGVDIWAGVGAIGQERRGDPLYAAAQARAAHDPTSDPEHRSPPLYQRYRQVGPVDDDLDEALSELTANSTGENATLLALDQAATGDGVIVTYEGAPLYRIPPRLDAGFRKDAIKVVFIATDTEPRDLENAPDLDDVVRHLRERSVLVLGTSNTSDGGAALEGDVFLQKLAKSTGAVLSSTDTIPCGGDSARVLRRGDPLVCDNAVGAAEMLGAALTVIPDFQRLTITATGGKGLVRPAGVQPASILNNARVAGVHRFAVTYSCAGLSPGTHKATVKVTARQRALASVSARVTCLAPRQPAAAPRRPRQPPLENADPPAAPPAPVQPVAQPGAQAQAQPNVNPQAHPQVGAVAQQDHEHQLAWATASDSERPAQELAMSGLGARQQHRDSSLPVYLTAAVMTGMATLPVQRQRQTQRAEARR